MGIKHKYPIPPTHWLKPQWKYGHWAYWFFDEVYRENVYLIWPATEKQRCDFVERQWGVRDPADDANWYGRHTEVYTDNGTGGHVISLRSWTGSAKDHSTLAHECLHCAHAMLRSSNVTPDFNNDEPLAYLLSRIVLTCTRAINAGKRK